MNLSRFLSLWVIFLLVFSCSKDAVPEGEEGQVQLPDFRLVGEDAENIFQYSYSSSTERGAQVNLTESLGVDPLYITLRQVDEVVSFYSFESGRFSLIQQNTVTGQSTVYPDFYTVNDERSIIWGANSGDLLFLGNYSPRGSRDFGVRTLDPSDGSFTDIDIELSIQQAYEPLYFRERLFITYRAGTGSYRMAIFNTETRAVMLTIDYGVGVPNVLIDDLGNIGILINNGNSEFVYQVMDLETLEQISEVSFTLNEFFLPGPLKGSVFGSTLYYTAFLPQPAEVLFGPAYFIKSTGESYYIDIISIVRQLESETGFNVDLTDLRYYEQAGVFLMGYANADSQAEVYGGVIAISKTGQLLDRIELPFVPTYFIRP